MKHGCTNLKVPVPKSFQKQIFFELTVTDVHFSNKYRTDASITPPLSKKVPQPSFEQISELVNAREYKPTPKFAV